MKQRAREAASTALLEAAEHVASERGIEQTSIAAIAERAQVAVGTLYNYFPDREALFAALFKWRRDEMIPRLVAAAATADEDGPFEQRLRALHAADRARVRRLSPVLPRRDVGRSERHADQGSRHAATSRSCSRRFSTA